MSWGWSDEPPYKRLRNEDHLMSEEAFSKGVATCATFAKNAKNAKSAMPFTIYAMTFAPWYFWHWP
jgi:hypothetical protein